MKAKVYSLIGTNTGKVEPTNEHITIRNGRYIERDTSHPLRAENSKYYQRVYGLEYKNKKIYWFDRFGRNSSNSGLHIGLNWFQNQRFQWMQGSHWFQKEENIRYLVNILFLIVGTYIAYLSLK